MQRIVFLVMAATAGCAARGDPPPRVVIGGLTLEEARFGAVNAEDEAYMELGASIEVREANEACR